MLLENHFLDLHIIAVTSPMGQLVSPLSLSFGNADMPIVKNADMNDSGRKNVVTTVNTSTTYET